MRVPARSVRPHASGESAFMHKRMAHLAHESGGSRSAPIRFADTSTDMHRRCTRAGGTALRLTGNLRRGALPPVGTGRLIDRRRCEAGIERSRRTRTPHLLLRREPGLGRRVQHFVERPAHASASSTPQRTAMNPHDGARAHAEVHARGYARTQAFDAGPDAQSLHSIRVR